ncbi:unnamed protein product (macronuclear) [Paramecium tetraurelia]|uniref:Transmembrane protein n=1 Tax=Paramecium tetraurelia TaxID=5888 RepID=A0BRC2_PARTE|nr:uncharacterized protein GSPATT00031320001 [Paramecium tetraurelia]CAK61089.1 unnamed protein product [Paramecium tetraurelia]|eukprot:XP_001428487.1 hypothetical protein (macronuclear) [Paramecium tetraurelia strain d4-2]
MKFIIFEQLSCLAHLPHNTQPSEFWVIFVAFIINLQYLAIMLPISGWNLWHYSNGHFYLLSKLAQASLIIPYGFESNFNFGDVAFGFVILLLITFVTIIAILVILGIQDDINPHQHYSLRKFIFYFFVLSTTIFQLPILFILISFITIGRTNFNQEQTIFNVKSVLSLITLFIFSIFVFLQQYFLRAYTFVPFNYLQQKFNGLQSIQYCFSILITILYLVDYDTIVQYTQILILFLQLLLRLSDSYFMKPSIPQINQLQFSFNFTLIAILIILTINILTNNEQIFQEDQLVYVIMLLGLMAFHLSYQFYNMKCLSVFDSEVTPFTCIHYTQEMHFKYLITNENQKNKEFFELYLYWKGHKVVCQKHWLKQNYRTDYNQIQRTHQTIFCILNTELERAQQDSKSTYEELQLLYISYVAIFCKKPLLAYVELKRYQSKQQIQSFYFVNIRYQMSIYLQALIKSQQQANQQLFGQQKVAITERQLSIESIFEALQFQDQFIPRVIELLNDKISFWNRQIKGFNNIYELERLAINQSKKIFNLANQINQYCSIDIKNLDHLSISNNVQDLKLISIFCSSIMNDYYSTQMCETAITEVYNIEHTLQEDTLTNLSFIQERAVILMLSLVKNRGRIINQDKKMMSQFFNYSEQEFAQIDNISGLMPPFFAERHDKLLLNYLQTAKSQFFDDYNQVFGQSKEGMLVSYQLKFDNNFSELDDYVLIGCLSQVKKSSDYLLFGEDGFLIGATENFNSTIINSKDQSYRILHENLSQLNAFLIIPNMMEILNELKNQFGKESIYIQQDKFYKIWKYNNNKDLYEMSIKLGYSSKQNSFINDSSLFKSRASFASIEKGKADIQIYQQLGQSVSDTKKLKGVSILQALTIYNGTFNSQLMNSLQVLESKAKQQYIAKINIVYKIIGKKENRRSYFILEINDLRKADELFKTNESLMNNQHTFSIQTTNKGNMHTFQDPSESYLGSLNVDKEEVTPHMSKQHQPGFARLLSKYEGKNQVQQNYMDLLGMESARDSISYGPLSQRINFISPSSKQQHMQELIDKDFMDLQNQLELGNDDIGNEIEVADSSKVKSNSKDQNQKSNNLMEILQNNRLNQKNEDLEREAKKSKSSITSGTSGISAISTIKKFQSKTEMTNSLRVLVIINIIIILIVSTYIIAHLMMITSYNNQTQLTLSNINGPTLFNRYFFKVFTYTWSLVFNSLGIIESSDYLITQTISQMADLASIIFDNLRNMYDTFIGIEQSGMLSSINLDFLYQDNENVTYTYFINIISNVADTLFQALKYNIKTLVQLIDRNYLDNLLMLRYNLKNVVNMNFQLIDSLNELFFEQQQSQIEEFQTQIIIEILFLILVIIFQLIYWKQIEQYSQQILILVGRLQLSQAQEMITRFTAVTETLKQLSGKYGWKKQNYYKLLFFPLNQIGIDTMQTQSRVLKEYQLSQVGGSTIKMNHMIEDRKNYKKNLNVVLNSKINNTNTSIWSATIIITITCIIFLFFLLGGFLLFKQQQSDLLPTQQLTLSFIRFTSQLDIVVSTAFITKTQPILYNKLVDLNIYSDEEIETFRDQRVIIKIFISLYSIYFENITQIYENIIESNKITDADENTLLMLFSNDFCELLSQDIPFCNYDNTTNFNEKYGTPTRLDDNRDYLSKGIQGVVSKLDQFFKQNYYYETNQVDYYPDLSVVLELFNTREFTNTLIEHFLDTTDGTNLFVDTILKSVLSITQNDLNLMYTYYLVTGLLLISIHFLFYGCWIHRTNQRLIELRLILTNLPIEVLTEQHTLSLLKKLQ